MERMLKSGTGSEGDYSRRAKDGKGETRSVSPEERLTICMINVVVEV